MFSIPAALTQRRLHTIAVTAIVAYMLPQFLMGTNGYVLVHDNLDANFVLFKMLVNSGHLFGDLHSKIDGILGGLPRNTLPSEFNVLNWLGLILEPLTAYLVGQTITHLVAYVGMFLLLRRHILTQANEHTALIVSGTALAFALLPFWPFGGLSVAGIPLATFALLNLRTSDWSWSDYAILAAIPLYSSLVLSFIFFLGLAAIVAIWDVAHRDVRARYIAGVLMMTTVFALVEYRLFYTMFVDTSVAWQRIEMNRAVDGAATVLQNAWRVLWKGQYHAHSVHTYIILPAVVLYCYRCLLARRLPTRDALLLGFIVFAAGAAGFQRWAGLKTVYQAVPLLAEFTWGRLHFLSPTAWYVLFAVALSSLVASRRWATGVLVALLGAQIGALVLRSDFVREYRNDAPTFNEFYAPYMFDQIKSFIAREPSSYKVASVGFHPNVTAYNELRTVDGYWPLYPLAQKQAIRRVVAPELAKDHALRDYFDHWGGRAYLFSAELQPLTLAMHNRGQVIRHLDLNMDALRSLGCSYILSSAEIANAGALGLEHLKTFVSALDGWTVRLYAVDRPNEDNDSGASEP